MVKIGLECHIQLTTVTKLFCGCSSNWQGKDPNTNVCDTCLGLPGTKPRINKNAIDYAIKVAIALGCRVPKESMFSRKSYMYPDMSKNYQISQFELPIAKDGMLKMDKKIIRITRINLEEDPARTVHLGSITTSPYTLVDYNRSGVPLCEIVTAPDLETPKEARLFLQEIASILEYLSVFDPSLEASIRIDANISVEKARVEIKNISGFKDVQRALSYEILRQRNLISQGKSVERETRTWDASAKVTRTLRSKEEEAEYGYITEPDLTKFTVMKDKIEKIKKTLPELASEKIIRYKKRFGIPEEMSITIVQDPEFALMFENVIKKIEPVFAAKWFSGEIKKTLNYNNLRLRDTQLSVKNIISLLNMVKKNKITEKTGEFLLREMITNPTEPEKLVEEKSASKMEDKEKLVRIVDKVLVENTKAVLDYKSGRREAFNYLVGQVMKATEGRGDPEKIREILAKKI